MDHVKTHSKDENKRSGIERGQDSAESAENVNGSYYYDDSSNYEVYQDDDDEVDDSQASERSAR